MALLIIPAADCRATPAPPIPPEPPRPGALPPSIQFQGAQNLAIILGVLCIIGGLFFADAAHAQSRSRIDSGVGTIVLPFEQLSNGLLLVEICVNDKPARLVLDTASEMTVLDNDLLGLSLRDLEHATARLPRQDGVRPSVLLRAMLGIGTLRLPSQRVAVSDLDGVSKTLGRRIDGILGLDVLEKFAEVTIRWRARQLVLVATDEGCAIRETKECLRALEAIR